MALTHSIGVAAIPDLISLLDKHERGRFLGDKSLAQYAIECLAEIGTPDALPIAETWAIEQLQREDVRDRIGGLRLVGKMRSERARSHIQRLLQDHEVVTRNWGYKIEGSRVSDLAAATLWDIAGRNAAPELETWAIEQLAYDDLLVRSHAIKLLERVGTERCISPLLTIPVLWDKMKDAVAIIRYRRLSDRVLYVIEHLQKWRNITLTDDQKVLIEKYKPLLHYKG